MQPFYFGSSRKALFGIHHPPPADVPRRGNAVLCHPFGREYLRAHRAMRELAHRLSQAGFHALRFDYYGCGDSAGDDEEGGIAEWVENTTLAIEEARALTGNEETSLVGLRLGGALASLAAARTRIANLVLWDPVVRGRDYVVELLALQKSWALTHPALPAAETAAPAAHILGFPLAAALREELERIDLLEIPPGTVRRLLLVESAENPLVEALRSRWQQDGRVVDHRRIPAAEFWLRQEGIEQALVPTETLRAIALWLGETPQ